MSTKNFKKLKVALVHDILVEVGGAEKVVLEIFEMFPQADLYLGIVNPDCSLYPTLKRRIKSIFLKSRLPRFFSFLKPFVYLYWESLSFKDYDLVISSSGSFSAKSIVCPHKSVHICYCHTPPKYLYREFAEQEKPSSSFSTIKNLFLHFMRIYDFVSAQRPDYFIANSITTKERMEKYYRRKAEVIYPPVRIPSRRELIRKKGNYYIYLGRIYKQKGIELLLETFNEIGRKLIVVGEGKELDNLKRMAKKNIIFKGFVDEHEKHRLLSNAKAYVNASVDEDFGIAPVEAMSFGVPVIAYRSGGLKETVVDGVTGIFFEKYSKTSLKKAILKFEKMSFNSEKCYEGAKKYSNVVFRRDMEKFLRKNIG